MRICEFFSRVDIVREIITNVIQQQEQGVVIATLGRRLLSRLSGLEV